MTKDTEQFDEHVEYSAEVLIKLQYLLSHINKIEEGEEKKWYITEILNSIEQIEYIRTLELCSFFVSKKIITIEKLRELITNDFVNIQIIIKKAVTLRIEEKMKEIISVIDTPVTIIH